MKEIIELEKHELYKLLDCLPMPMVTDDDLEKEIKEGKKLVLFGKERRVEQVPETWEELKELCIKLKRDYDITYVSSTIWVHGLSFNETGIIGDSHHSFIVEDRTPAQMWRIIKDLIGEE